MTGETGPKFQSLFFAIAAFAIFCTVVLISTSRQNDNLTTEKTKRVIDARQPPELVDESLERGLFYLHSQTSGIITGLDESLGSGACAFDFDNDQDMDIYLVGGSGQQRFYGKATWWSMKRTGRLYRNRGDGYFDDITEESGLEVSHWGMGCNVADFDQDGYVDLLVTGRKEDRLWENLNGAGFQPVDFPYATNWSTSAAVGDYNSDGLMDVYLARYLDYDNAAKRFEGLSGYQTDHTAFQAASFAPQPNLLLRNLGDFKFDESTAVSGLDNRDGRSLGAKWFDINQDYQPDLLVANDTGSISRWFYNLDESRFVQVGLAGFPEVPSGIRDAAIQDLDGDGDPDLALSSPLGEISVLLTGQNGSFTDATWQQHRDSGRFAGLSGYGLAIADLNNDGHQDIYHANGLSAPEPDVPAISAGQPDLVSIGDGDGNFEFASASANFNESIALPLSTRSVIKSDVDNDGDRDLIVTANNNPVRLLINHAQMPNWIGFDIRDQHGNRGNFGKVVLYTNRTKSSYFADHDTFLGHHDHRISQVLGSDETILKAIIHWRDGQTIEINNIEPGAYNLIKQNDPNRRTYRKVEKQPKSIPTKLVAWQLKVDQVDPAVMLLSFRGAKNYDRLQLIDSLSTNPRSRSEIILLRAALDDPNSKVVLAALNHLEQLELEASYYWLSTLFNREDPEVLCAVATTFRRFYIEEEAMIHRKALAVPHLLKLLEHDDSEVISCATLALAESKNYRAVVPIEELLLSHVDSKVLNSAIYALGELRRTRSVEAILARATDDPELQRTRRRALQQLNVGLETAANTKSDLTFVSDNPTVSACPVLSAEVLIGLSLPEQAEAFDTCALDQQRFWLEKNFLDIESNAEKLLANKYLSPETFTLIVDRLTDSRRLELTSLFIKALNQDRDYRQYSALIKALEIRMPDGGFEKLLRRIIEDTTKPAELRIAAGDYLIEIDPAYTMSFAGDLFE